MFLMGQRNKIIFLHAIPCWDVQATNQKILLQDSEKAPRVKYSGRPRAPQWYEADFHGKSCRVLPGKGNCSPTMKARASVTISSRSGRTRTLTSPSSSSQSLNLAS